MDYKYYDTPEGEDCLKKVFYMSKLAGISGLVVSTADVILLSRPRGYLPTVARYGYVTLPMIGMAAAFASTTCIATQVRKKDGKMNYILGGLAAAAVFGAWRGSILHGFNSCWFFVPAAFWKKISVDEGWQFIAPVKREWGSAILGRTDYTCMEERPRNWKVAAD